MGYKRENVAMHSDGFRPALPAVNVKLDCMFGFPESVDWSDVDVVADDELDNLRAFIESEFGEERDPYGENLWSVVQAVAIGEVEYLADWALELFGPGVEIWQQGRSGGWLVVDGLPDIESWDAIMLSRWGTWERGVRSVIDAFPTMVATTIAINDFEFHCIERDAMAADDAAGTLPVQTMGV